MKITPLDIQQQKFRKVFRGCDSHEVQAFMDLLKTAFEELILENNSIIDDLKRKEALLEEYKEREKLIKETIIMSQKISEEIKVNAEKEADAIIAHARVKAQEIISSAHVRTMEIKDEIKELRRQRLELESKLRSLLDTHVKLLDALSESRSKDQIEDKIRFITKTGEERK
ncbi:MAG TPA: DivIVA domain-containing protein [bacterium]